MTGDQMAVIQLFLCICIHEHYCIALASIRFLRKVLSSLCEAAYARLQAFTFKIFASSDDRT